MVIGLKSPLITGSLFSSLTLPEISAACTTGIQERQKREEKSRKEKGKITDLLKNNKLLHGRVERPS